MYFILNLIFKRKNSEKNKQVCLSETCIWASGSSSDVHPPQDKSEGHAYRWCNGVDNSLWCMTYCVNDILG